MRVVISWRVQPPAGYSADQSGLLYMKHSISNFEIYIRRAQCTGWDERPGANVCTWPGVSCVDGKVVGLHFLNNGSALVGESHFGWACTRRSLHHMAMVYMLIARRATKPGEARSLLKHKACCEICPPGASEQVFLPQETLAMSCMGPRWCRA
jgi:hypothetical protein